MTSKEIDIFELTGNKKEKNKDSCILKGISLMSIMRDIRSIKTLFESLGGSGDLTPDELWTILLMLNGYESYPQTKDIKSLILLGDGGFDYVEVNVFDTQNDSDILVSELDIQRIKKDSIMHLLNRIAVDNQTTY